MKINLIKGGASLVMLLAPVCVCATEVPALACPEIIPAAAVKIDRAAETWMPSVPGDFRLSSAGFNNGPPEKKADLKPDSVTERRQHSVATWRFDEDGFVDGLWLACAYGGAAGEIILARRLPDGYRSCSVSGRPSSKAGAQVIQITCR